MRNINRRTRTARIISSDPAALARGADRIKLLGKVLAVALFDGDWATVALLEADIQALQLAACKR
jgi:hypothetical protein